MLPSGCASWSAWLAASIVFRSCETVGNRPARRGSRANRCRGQRGGSPSAQESIDIARSYWQPGNLATTFLAVAASLLAGLAYLELSLLWRKDCLDEQVRRSIESVSIEGSPPVLVDYDTSQPGRPVVRIDCARKPVSDNHLRSLLHQPRSLLG